ncbi:MAG: response regulator [Polyangiaceae bacterium]
MAEQSLRVLVVDDTVVYRRILQNVVAEIAGAEVIGTAANGRIALDRLEQLEIDIVLLDVEMPELGGLARHSVRFGVGGRQLALFS